MVVADTEPVFAAGASAILAEAGLSPTVHAPSAPLRGLADRRAAAVLLDAGLGRSPYAAELVAELIERAPQMGVVVVVRRTSAEGSVQAMEAGARALVHRQCTPRELVAAVSAAVRGQDWVAAPLAGTLRAELLAESTGSGALAVSPRELDVLRGLATGATNAEIGLRLGISANTVRNHVHSLMRKLEAANRTDAVATALRRGLVQLPD
ncbi:MAG: response regulator transcription factor [Candidatus Nanopelagicales bacterium]